MPSSATISSIPLSGLFTPNQVECELATLTLSQFTSTATNNVTADLVAATLTGLNAVATNSIVSDIGQFALTGFEHATDIVYVNIASVNATAFGPTSSNNIISEIAAITALDSHIFVDGEELCNICHAALSS